MSKVNLNRRGLTSNRMLATIIERLNTVTDSPLSPTVTTADRTVKSATGHHFIDHAYNKVALHRFTNDKGGEEDIFRHGHIKRPLLLALINAYLLGIQCSGNGEVTVKGGGK